MTALSAPSIMSAHRAAARTLAGAMAMTASGWLISPPIFTSIPRRNCWPNVQCHDEALSHSGCRPR